MKNVNNYCNETSLDFDKLSLCYDDILTTVRKRLGDVSKQRWDDELLEMYFRYAWQDLILITDINKKEVEYDLTDNLVNGNNYIKLSIASSRIHRVEVIYKDSFSIGKEFNIESRKQIELGKAKFPCLVFDNVPDDGLKFYLYLGRPEDIKNWDMSVVYQAYNIPMYDNDGNLNHICLKFTYTDFSMPDFTLDDNGKRYLNLSKLWERAFVHYIVGMCLMDDNDANNYDRGTREMGNFSKIVPDIYKRVTKDYTSNMYNKFKLPRRRYE